MGVEVDVAARRSALARAGAWLFPVPAFLRGRRGGDADPIVSQWSLTVSSHAEPMGSSLAKAAAAAATLAVATFGSGVVQSRSPSAAGAPDRAKPAQVQGPAKAPAPVLPATARPAGSRRDDRRVPVEVGGTTTVMTPEFQNATTPAAGEGQSSRKESAPSAPGGGSTDAAPARDGSPTPAAPTQDEVLGQVDDTASGSTPKAVEVPSVDTPAGSTPKVTATPERPAAPVAPTPAPAPPPSVEQVTSGVTGAVQTTSTGVRVDTSAVDVDVATG